MKNDEAEYDSAQEYLNFWIMKNDFQPKVFVLSVYVHFKIDYYISYDASLLEMSMDGSRRIEGEGVKCLNLQFFYSSDNELTLYYLSYKSCSNKQFVITKLPWRLGLHAQCTLYFCMFGCWCWANSDIRYSKISLSFCLILQELDM